MEDEVVFSEAGGIGCIRLNRPAALNTLTLGMCQAMASRLRQWACDDTIRAVFVRQTGDKAFCAGGDIRKVALGTVGYRLQFFSDEYRLNALIKHYPKPYISLIDGICMGGGVGISAHGSHRVLTDRVQFAMPEVAIGFFPDVGASYLLSRMPGQLGVYLGLIGRTLGPADSLYCGYGTHYITRDRLTAFEGLPRAGALDAWLRDLTCAPPKPDIVRYEALINELFQDDTVEEIVERLQADPSEFAARTAAAMAPQSPFALKVTLGEIREARQLSFDDCLRMEWRIASRLVQRVDFSEGVRALILDKDRQPKWHPARLSDVDESELLECFRPGPDGELDLA